MSEPIIVLKLTEQQVMKISNALISTQVREQVQLGQELAVQLNAAVDRAKHIESLDW